eukprot:scaffold5295_cov215-Skeletonema_marinoi.AAC.4
METIGTIQRARTMPPFSSVSTAETDFSSIQRGQAVFEDSGHSLQLHWRQGESTLRSVGTKWLLETSEVIEIRN